MKATLVLNNIICAEIQKLSGAVSGVTGYGIDAFTSDSRVRSLMAAKALFCYFLHEKFRDFEVISEVLHRHRSNAYHLLKNHNDLMATDRLYQQYFREIENILNQNNDETEEN